MTNAQYNEQINAQIDGLIAVRAQYDAIAKAPVERMYADNAREQAALITGQIARLRALRIGVI